MNIMWSASPCSTDTLATVRAALPVMALEPEQSLVSFWRHSGWATMRQFLHFTTIFPKRILFPHGMQVSGRITWRKSIHYSIRVDIKAWCVPWMWTSKVVPSLTQRCVWRFLDLCWCSRLSPRPELQAQAQRWSIHRETTPRFGLRDRIQ